MEKYNGMTGSLFTGEVLTLVENPANKRRLDKLTRLSEMSSRLGQMKGEDLIAISIGHDTGITPDCEFVEWVKSSCKTARKFACDCADAKPDNRKNVYKNVLRSQLEGILVQIDKRWAQH